MSDLGSESFGSSSQKIEDQARSSFRKTVLFPALRTSLLFFLVSTVWIFATDFLVLRLIAPDAWARLQTLKGWLFVTVTASFLFLIIYRDLNALHREQKLTRSAWRRVLELIENSPIGIAVLDERGTIVKWNRAAEQILGWSEAEVLGKPVAVLGAGDEFAGFASPLDQGAPDAGRGRLCRFTARDGRMVDVDARVRPLCDESGRVTGGTLIFDDITERKQAEDALRESEERFRRVATEAPYPVILFAEDGEILLINRQWTRITGYQQDELPDIDTWTEKAYGERKHQVRQRIQQLFALGGREREEEFEIRTKTGERRTWNFSSSPMGRLADGRRLMVSMASDITARREAEDALRLSEKRLERAQRMAALGNWELDLQTGKTLLSDEVYRIFGVDKLTHSPTRENFSKFVHPDDLGAVEEAMRKTSAAARQFNVIHRVVRPDGEIRHVREYGEAVFNERGEVRGYIGTVQDITEYKLLEQQLHHAQRMEAVGRLAGGVAHDFNNLLTVVNGYSQLLLARMPGEESGRSALEQIHKAGERAAQLTRQLLAFSRKQIMNPRVLDLNSILDSMRGLLERLIPEHIELALALDPALGSVRVDAGQVEQVVMNLAVNAVDAMPAGGRLTIATERRSVASGEISVEGGVLPPGQYAVLRVHDEGVGMGAETMQRIFEPFFTTKEVGKGTGLGLATVFGIVTQSGGYVQVDSAPGKGSEFRVFLPRVGDLEDAAAAETPSWTLLHGTGTVLLVEDEDIIRKFAARLLEEAGYSVIEAGDGLAALEMLQMRESAEPVDLLLTDLVMPKLSGLDLARRVREKRPGLPVVFMSGYAETSGNSHDEGIRRHLLQKPFKPEELLMKVGEALAG